MMNVRGRTTLRPLHSELAANNERDIQTMRCALADLEKAQQNSAMAILSTINKVEALAKEVEALKQQQLQLAQSRAVPSQSQVTSPSPRPHRLSSSSRGCRIPSELSAFVKRIYSGLSADGQFKAEERYRSEHNQQVSLRLLEQIKRNPILKQYHNFHDKAVYRYYESRRRQYKDMALDRAESVKINEKNSKKRRSQKMLYQQRQAFLKDDERGKWEQIDALYMTSESDTEQNGRKVKETHRPAWRSTELNRLIAKLDKRLADSKSDKERTGFHRLERVAGLPSKSEAPIGAPHWAVSAESQLGVQLQLPSVSSMHSASSTDSPPGLQAIYRCSMVHQNGSKAVTSENDMRNQDSVLQERPSPSRHRMRVPQPRHFTFNDHQPLDHCDAIELQIQRDSLHFHEQNSPVQSSGATTGTSNKRNRADSILYDQFSDSEGFSSNEFSSD